MTNDIFLNECKNIATTEEDFRYKISNNYKEETLDAILTLLKNSNFKPKELEAFLFEPIQPLPAIEHLIEAATIVEGDHRLLSLFKVTEDEEETIMKQKAYLVLLKNNVSIKHIFSIIEQEMDVNVLLENPSFHFCEVEKILNTHGIKLLKRFLTGFDENQKVEILLGLFDETVAPYVYLYAHPQMPYPQMLFIREYLKDRSNPRDKILFLLQPDLRFEQLFLIKEAILAELSTDLLLEVCRFPADKLQEMKEFINLYKNHLTKPVKRENIKEDKSLTTIAEMRFTASQQAELAHAKANKLPKEVLEYINNPLVPCELMKVISFLSKEGVPLQKIKDYLANKKKSQTPNVWIGLLRLKDDKMKSD